MRTLCSVIAVLVFSSIISAEVAHSAGTVTLPSETVRDKIRGGLLGQIFANLNGLKYENRHIHQPGNVTEYVPSLPDGAETDDDTDIEWVYILAMQKHGLFVPYDILSNVWKRHINRYIWCSHQYVRHLLDLGVPTELTGSEILNPWAEFNIAGQFTCEMFGQMSPLMPRSGSLWATHYLRVIVDGEPLQTTQFFVTIIASAFETDDIPRLVDAGLEAVDPQSNVYEIVRNTRKWCEENPDDWKATRKLIHDTYTKHQGRMRDYNGYELNTAATVAALIYGKGDYVETAIHAFNFGWDADNTAAAAGTVIGVIHGEKWFRKQGWDIKDVYKNTRRDEMPLDETLTSFGDRLIELAEKRIVAQGGKINSGPNGDLYEIRVEKPANVLPLCVLKDQRTKLLKASSEKLTEAFEGEPSPMTSAGSAYLAICLDIDKTLQERNPARWNEWINALNHRQEFLKIIGGGQDVPTRALFREKLRNAGVHFPATEKKP